MVANVKAPFGFRDFGRQEGGSPTAGLTRVFVLSSDANAIFTGDCVQPSTASYGYVTQATTGSVGVAGVFRGCEYYNPTVGRQVWSAYFPGNVSSSSPVTAYINNDPESLFIVQGSTSGVLGSSVIGWNAGFLTAVSSTGNTLSGVSVVSLQSSTVSANSSLPFRIVDVYLNCRLQRRGNGNFINTTVGAILVVAPNNWQRANLTGVST